MKENYFKSIVMIERLQRLFLDVMKVELDRMKIHDINSVQCVVLYNIGMGQYTVGELTNRGYYLGSNVTYNLKSMVKNGYVIQEPCEYDRRASYVKLSDKGLELHKKLDKFFTTHAHDLDQEGMDVTRLDNIFIIGDHLESFWTDLLTRRR